MRKFELNFSVQLSDEAIELLNLIHAKEGRLFAYDDLWRTSHKQQAELFANKCVHQEYSGGNPTYNGLRITAIGESVLQILNA